jgi:hypothetical protein
VVVFKNRAILFDTASNCSWPQSRFVANSLTPDIIEGHMLQHLLDRAV